MLKAKPKYEVETGNFYIKLEKYVSESSRKICVRIIIFTKSLFNISF
jgi:hypothetical protein